MKKATQSTTIYLLPINKHTLFPVVQAGQSIRKGNREMKKTLFAVAVVMAVCILFAGIASAEYGYTRVSDIPMAVDFTYSAGINEDGTPYLQTDYPFEETGAMQMVLIYVKEELYVLDIRYDPLTGQSEFGRFAREAFPNPDREQMIQEAARMIRDGEIAPGYIYI